MTNSEVPKKFNFFFLLFHPMRALRFLRESSDHILMLENKDKELANAESRCKQLSSETQIITQERDDLKKRLDETLVSVDFLTKQTLQQRAELDELRDTNKRLDIFMSELQKVEEMKRNYENRIKIMQIKIDNLIAENALLEPGELDEPTPIQLTPKRMDKTVSSESSSRRRRNPHDTDDSDWLQHL